MPKIFEYFGFIFYFYSNEHEPIHVHVQHGGKESIFELIIMYGKLIEVKTREKHGLDPLSNKDQRTAIEFIEKYHKNIIDKWIKFIRRHPHPQYNKYLDPKRFKKFEIENGNIVWGKNWDLIFPLEQLYAGKIV